MVVATLCETNLEGDLSLLQLIFVCVDLSGKVAEEGGCCHTDLVHLEVEFFHVLNGIHDHGFCLKLASLDCGSCTLVYNAFKSLTLL